MLKRISSVKQFAYVPYFQISNVLATMLLVSHKCYIIFYLCGCTLCLLFYIITLNYYPFIIVHHYNAYRNPQSFYAKLKNYVTNNTKMVPSQRNHRTLEKISVESRLPSHSNITSDTQKPPTLKMLDHKEHIALKSNSTLNLKNNTNSFHNRNPNGFQNSLNTSINKQVFESSRAFRSRKVLPHAIIIGAKKCGTRALINILDCLHPYVKKKRKEAHFFDEDKNYKKGISWYRRKMPGLTSPKDLIIEKTPSYFIDERAPERIHKHIPRVKLILSVCDPVKRSMSDFLHLQDGGRIPKTISFVNYITNKSDVYDPRVGIINHSRYDLFIKHWLDLFPRKQLLIVNGETLLTNPYTVFRKIETFLDLPHYIREDQFVKIGNFFCWRKTSKHKPRCMHRVKNHSKGRTHPQPPESAINYLRSYFTPWNKLFFKITGVDFKWNMNKAK